MNNNLISQNTISNPQLIHLFYLKSAAHWLEKQEWVSSPYGGENYLEDLLSHINIHCQQEWNSLFQGQSQPEDLNQLKNYFEILQTLDPRIEKYLKTLDLK